MFALDGECGQSESDDRQRKGKDCGLDSADLVTATKGLKGLGECSVALVRRTRPSPANLKGVRIVIGTGRRAAMKPSWPAAIRVAFPALAAAILLELERHAVDTVHKIDRFAREFGTV